MESTGDLKLTVSLPTFDGSEEKFAAFWTRFQAYAQMKGFAAVLKENVLLPATADEVVSATDQDKAEKDKNRKANHVAMAMLTMAMVNEGDLAFIYQSYTNEYPGGLVHKVVSAMMEQYRPKDRISRVEMRQALMSLKMGSNENPKLLFERIAGIQNKYNLGATKIDPEDLIAAVLTKAPAKYAGILTAEARSKGDQLTLLDLKTAMMQHWRILSGKEDEDEEESGKELSLTAFGGICYKCGEKGHKAFKCPKADKKDNKGKKRFNGKCHLCGKEGHKKAQCWELESNKHLRPKNWVSAKEQEKGLAASNGVEYLLMAYEKQFPGSTSLLKDPNVWIADTGATTHSSPHEEGMIELDGVSETDGITMGNGTSEKVVKMGQLKGIICDKKGKELQPAKLDRVKVCPTQAFNLFSLTRMMKNGWKLQGNDQMIWITKGDMKITFDIKINTPEGALYCMYLKRNIEMSAAAIATTKRQMTKKQAHDLLSHACEAETVKTAKYLGWELLPGAMEPCPDCAAGKARQKNVPKDSTDKRSTVNMERVYHDIATIKKPKGMEVTISKPNWRILVEEKTNTKFSAFFKKKNGMIEPTCEQFEKWRQAGMPVKFLRCDNAGENKKLKERADGVDWKLNIQFEFTARNTPQQNHLAELGLQFWQIEVVR